MAAEDDLITRLTFETHGQEAIAAATAALADNENHIRYVLAAMTSSDAPTAAYESRLRDLAKANTQLTKELAGLQKAQAAAVLEMERETAAEVAAEMAAKKHAQAMELATAAARQEADALANLDTWTTRVSTATAEVHTGSTRAAMGLLQLGYAADDMQYGFRGIANNLPMIAMAFGGGAGLGGMVAIAATAINQLIIHWSDLTDLFIGSKTETEAERMERLGNSTHRTADETKELNKYKQEQAEIEERLRRFGQLQPEAQKEREQALQKMLAEEGPGVMQAGVAKQMEQEGRERVRTILERQSDLAAAGPLSAAGVKEYNQLQAELTDLRGKLRTGVKAFNDEALKLMDEAIFKGDIGAFRRIQGMAERRPGEFAPGILQGLQAASPEQQALEQQGREQEAENERKAKVREAANRQAEQLNRQAQEGEIAAQRQRDQENKAATQDAEKAKKAQDKITHDINIHAMREARRQAFEAGQPVLGDREKFAREQAQGLRQQNQGQKAAMEQQMAAFIQQNAVTPQGGAYTPAQAMIAAKKAVALMARDNLNAMQAAEMAVVQLNTELQQIAHKVNGIGNNFRRVHQASRMRMGNRNPF